MKTTTKRMFRAYLCGGFAILTGCGGIVTNPPSGASAGSGGSGGGDSSGGADSGSGGSGGPSAIAECAPEGNTPDAMAFCDDLDFAEPYVFSWCAAHGGCHTARCGEPPVMRAPSNCLYGGESVSTDGPVWCCFNKP